MISELLDAIHPSRIPAKLNALDIELVEIVFSYPKSRIDGGFSAGPREWNSGR
jgi:hypothetical protein